MRENPLHQMKIGSRKAAETQRKKATKTSGLVLDLFLQQFDFFRGEVEEAINAGVEVGFGGGEGSGEAGLVVALFVEVGFPVVGDGPIFGLLTPSGRRLCHRTR